MYKELGLDQRPCVLCKENQFTLLTQADRYGFDLNKQICENCGLVQTNPSLKSKFLDEFYSHYYRPLYLKSENVNYEMLASEQATKGRRFIDYLRENGLADKLNDLSVVEIGCSSGGILAEMLPEVKSVQGCDLDIEGVNYGNKLYDFKMEVSALPTSLPESPKLFLLSHVLEHLYDPLQTVKYIRELMTEDDYLLIEVPGLNAVGEGDYGGDLWAYFHIAHVSDFTAGTIKVLAANAGFSILSCNETVTALMVRNDLEKENWERDAMDTVENVVRIERKYIGK
jgi:SAM-dependent methyltransferase